MQNYSIIINETDKSKKISFFSFFRLILIGFFLLAFHLLASKSYAAQPTAGSWTFVGLSNINIHSIAVDPNNPNTLYAGTGGYGLFKSIDTGATWTAIDNGISNPSSGYFTDIVIDPSNSSIVYVGGVGDFGYTNATSIFKSTDAGVTWILANNGIVDVGFGAPPEDVHSLIIDPNNPSTLYAALGNHCGSVYKTTDAATTWTRGNNLPCDEYVVRLNPTNANALYTRSGSGIFKSSDGGLNWNNISNLNNGGYALAIDPFNSANLYANSTGDGVNKSTDDGVSWALSSSALNDVYKALITDPVRPNTLYSANNDGSDVFQSTDGGATWTDINNGFPNVGSKRLLVPANNPNVLYDGTNSGIYVYGLPSLNKSPVINPLSNATLNEGDTFAENGSFTDPDSTSWTATVDFGDGSGTQPLTLSGTNFTLSYKYKDEGTFTVTVSVTDNQGATGTGTATVTVNNATFSVGAITVQTPVIQVNSLVSASVSYTDTGVLDTHTASWNWGDGNTTTGTVTESNGSGTVSDSHSYTTAGVYIVTLTVADDDGLSNSATYQYISVYNPTSQGLFSAGQHFTSPVGAYAQNPSLTGTVKFGLSYKYQGSVPVGNKEFTMNFNAANLTFNATTVSSLVIANNMATLTGTGTINGGSHTYNFLVTGVNGGGIRIQITDPSNNNSVIYDTQPGVSATATPTTSGSGQVVVHN